MDKEHFTVRASASRLSKGLLAIPQKFKHLFPDKNGPIAVVFDDEDQIRTLTFHPHDPIVKENRIFGLGRWFAERGVRAGDAISITIENRQGSVYRIALDRYIHARQEQIARLNLRSAQTDPDAERQLDLLSKLTSKKPRKVAQEELLRIARELTREARPTTASTTITRNEGVPAWLRILLRELYEGKCQLCSFTFEKRNGEPYFEIHHLDPRIGHHPTNLLVVCPNCHAQLEHAKIAGLQWAGPWLVGLTINGKRVAVRQPLAHDSLKGLLLSLVILVAATRFASLRPGQFHSASIPEDHRGRAFHDSSLFRF